MEDWGFWAYVCTLIMIAARAGIKCHFVYFVEDIKVLGEMM